MLWMSFGFDPGAPKGSPPAPAGVSWGGVAATVAHVQRCDASTGGPGSHRLVDANRLRAGAV